MLSINPRETPIADLHQYLLGAVAPRPICFASTISEDGTPNIAPYSFFNVFSSNPPTAIFSSNRTVANNTTKDTLANVQSGGEVVINVVNYNIVRQMAIASVSYPAEVSEFEKAGLTPIPSDIVKPFRVKESPVQMECKVTKIQALGDGPGAGNLIFCDIVRIHINKAVLDEEGKIDPHKIDLMGRMGRAFYCRAAGNAISKIFQPVPKIPIGFDGLPKSIRQSTILTGNDLGQLAGLLTFPDASTIETVAQQHNLATLPAKEMLPTPLHQKAKILIADSKVVEAMCLLLYADKA